MQIAPKTKLLAAYEDEDSVTFRFTPETLARLLLSNSIEKTEMLFGYLPEHSVFLTDEKRLHLIDCMEKAAHLLRRGVPKHVP